MKTANIMNPATQGQLSNDSEQAARTKGSEQQFAVPNLILPIKRLRAKQLLHVSRHSLTRSALDWPLPKDRPECGFVPESLQPVGETAHHPRACCWPRCE